MKVSPEIIVGYPQFKLHNTVKLRESAKEEYPLKYQYWEPHQEYLTLDCRQYGDNSYEYLLYNPATRKEQWIPQERLTHEYLKRKKGGIVL